MKEYKKKKGVDWIYFFVYIYETISQEIIGNKG